jgi:hypothetical protein
MKSKNIFELEQQIRETLAAVPLVFLRKNSEAGSRGRS